MSRTTKSRKRAQLSRAELKAYEARRAAEGRRIGVTPTVDAGVPSSGVAQTRRSYTLTRDEEYSIIRSDLRRLLIILGLLAAVLIVITFVLR